jgi:hypothetical protein
MALAWRPLTRSEWRLVTGLAILIGCMCAPPAPRLAPVKHFSGKWTGLTSHGRAIAFTVYSNRITALTFDYACSGGSGSLSIPADVPLLNTTGRTAAAVVTLSSDGPSGPTRILVRFLFPSVKRANGTVEFTNDPACGSSDVTWTAKR